MHRVCALLLCLGLGCASAPQRPPPKRTQAAKPPPKGYVGPVWFDAGGKQVVRTSKAKGKIAIDHKYAAEISVNGNRVASAPYAGEIELPMGLHRITVQEPGCAPRHFDVEVQTDKTLPINTVGPCLPPGTVTEADPNQEDPNQGIVYSRTDHTGAWVVVGVGAALAVAGGVFIGTHVAAAKKRDRLIEEEPDRFDARPVRRADNEAYAWSIAAVSAFGAGAVAFATSIILFLTNTGEAAPDYNFGGVQLTPTGIAVDF